MQQWWELTSDMEISTLELAFNRYSLPLLYWYYSQLQRIERTQLLFISFQNQIIVQEQFCYK